jgi:hypothetical protein
MLPTKLIGKLYMQNVRRMDIASYRNERARSTEEYREAERFVHAVERALQDMDREYQEIIRNEYLKTGDRNWHMDYYSKTTFYVLRKKAIRAFADCLDI